MAEGEHTIVGKIPLERLHQIAGQKLSALGVAVRPGADRSGSAGELVFAPPFVGPLGGTALARARFLVEGHDRVRFVEPPLSALGPVPFYDLERAGQLEARLLELVRRRSAALQDVAARMRALRLEPAILPDQLAVRAVVRTMLHTFELVGGPDGVRVTRVATPSGKAFEVPASFRPVILEEHASPADLEVWLEGSLPAMQAVRGEPAPAAVRVATGRSTETGIQLTPAPRNALTVERLAQAFGAGAVLAPNAPVEVLQELEHGGTRYRFVAAREVGTSFRGRLIGPAGDVWTGRFELESFGGTAQLAAAVLGAPAGEAAAPAAPAGDIPQHLLPRLGEVWVMNVVVEHAGPEEVRYVGTDIDGRPYGAARVLKRSAFEAVFSHERGGWRLLVVVDQVADGNVVYRQLDRQRQPAGSPRRIPIPVLVANFVPEAAAY